MNPIFPENLMPAEATVTPAALSPRPTALKQVAPASFRFYRHALEIMSRAQVPFLVGGAYAFACYTGIARHTKDFDVFLRRHDLEAALRAFAEAGYRAEDVFSHWLAKVYHDDDFIDLIFASGNSVCPVDDAWFAHAVSGEVLGEQTLLIPAEEMIWQKAFIMERERFDGADIIHLLRVCGRQLDWDRLLARFGPHWRVLLAHLVLFGFVYPDDRASVPAHMLESLTARLHAEQACLDGSVECRGALLSRMQYLTDLEHWGYADPRRTPTGSMSPAQIKTWTDAGR